MFRFTVVVSNGVEKVDHPVARLLPSRATVMSLTYADVAVRLMVTALVSYGTVLAYVVVPEAKVNATPMMVSALRLETVEAVREMITVYTVEEDPSWDVTVNDTVFEAPGESVNVGVLLPEATTPEIESRQPVLLTEITAAADVEVGFKTPVLDTVALESE